MFFNFLLFELKLRLKSVSTYVFFLLAALLPFFAVSTRDFGPIGSGKSSIIRNSPPSPCC